MNGPHPGQQAVRDLVREQRDQDRAKARWELDYATARRAHRTAAAQLGRARVLRDRVLVRDGELVLDLAQRTFDAYTALTMDRLSDWQRLHDLGLHQGWIDAHGVRR